MKARISANIFAYTLSIAFVILIPVRSGHDAIRDYFSTDSVDLPELIIFAIFAPVVFALVELIRNIHLGSLAVLFGIERGKSCISGILSRISYDPFGFFRGKRADLHVHAEVPSRQPFWLLLRTTGSVFLGGAAISAAMHLIFPLPVANLSVDQIGIWARLALLGYLVFLAPMMETLMNSVLLFIFMRLPGATILRVSLLSALVWSLLHAVINSSVEAPASFWLFFIFSGLYLYGARQWGAVRSTIAVAVVHCLNNAMASAALSASIFRTLMA